MKKYTIKQTEPDYERYYQDYLLEIACDNNNPIFIEGDDIQEGVNEKWLFKLMDYMERCVNEFDRIDIYDPEQNYMIEDLMTDYFPGWNDEQIKKLVEVATELYENNCTWEDEIVARYLSAFYKTEYTYKAMIVFPNINFGLIYYPKFASDESISFIESLYLGTYDEFYNEEENEYRIVTHDDLWGDPKKTVARAFDLNPEEIEVYKITGYQRVPTYQLID